VLLTLISESQSVVATVRGSVPIRTNLISKLDIEAGIFANAVPSGRI
jgi:hypothetical protein